MSKQHIVMEDVMDNTTETIAKMLEALPEPVRAAMISFIVAMLRVVYDGKEPRWVRRILEATLCGTIALAVTHLTTALGFSSGWGVFLGAAIGLFGADQVREWGRRIAERRVR